MFKKKFYIIFFIVIFLLTGCSYNHTGWNINQLHIKKVWKISKGSNQTIAFLDTGISPNLKELMGDRIVNPYNVLENNTNVDDINGHGTEMISAACGSGEYDIWGVAPEVKIMPIVTVDQNGNATPEILTKGVQWAIKNDADIINISIGGYLKDEGLKKAIESAVKKNIFVVAAAGDYSEPELLFPARMSSVISVEAQKNDGNRLEYSNYSNNSIALAPGFEIPVLSIDTFGKPVTKKANGTSVATAQVSGIIALSLDIYSKLTIKEFIYYLDKSIGNDNFIDAQKLIENIKFEKIGGNKQ